MRVITEMGWKGQMWMNIATLEGLCSSSPDESLHPLLPPTRGQFTARVHFFADVMCPLGNNASRRAQVTSMRGSFKQWLSPYICGLETGYYGGVISMTTLILRHNAEWVPPVEDAAVAEPWSNGYSGKIDPYLPPVASSGRPIFLYKAPITSGLSGSGVGIRVGTLSVSLV